MAHGKTAASGTAGRVALGSQVRFAVLALAAMAGGLLVLRLIPLQLALPALSIAFLSAGAGLALLAWRLRVQRQSDRVDLWDVAGAFTFIGFAAGMVSQPEQVVELFGYAPASR